MDEVTLGLRDVALMLAVVGGLITIWRFTLTRRHDRDALRDWRKDMENRVSNQESYIRRVESEYKQADDEHKLSVASLIEEMRRGFARLDAVLQDVVARLVRAETRADARKE